MRNSSGHLATMEGGMDCKHLSNDGLAPIGEFGKVLCVDCHTKVDCPHPPEFLKAMKPDDYWKICRICHMVIYRPCAAFAFH